jgi:hypothetical protein
LNEDQILSWRIFKGSRRRPQFSSFAVSDGEILGNALKEGELKPSGTNGTECSAMVRTMQGTDANLAR